ncbi:fumarylacetoacetate hydrolase family protein [Rhizobium sp. F40D2]|uniref:fumarylacetoacetate hydrolase family protein n=1 Tax=Rhizobium sp. F40D2 TaxID=3453141 RepID=UPI003F2029FB
MIFDIARQIEICSSFTRLDAGDVILNGTHWRQASATAWMKPGDVVGVEIHRMGELCNPSADETAQLRVIQHIIDTAYFR